MKLRTKIFIMVLGCVLAALIIQTCLFQNLSSKLIYEQAKEESEQSMQSMQNEIYGLIKGIENNLIEIYMDDELLQSLRKKETVKELQSKFYRKAYDKQPMNLRQEMMWSLFICIQWIIGSSALIEELLHQNIIMFRIYIQIQNIQMLKLLKNMWSRIIP